MLTLIEIFGLKGYGLEGKLLFEPDKAVGPEDHVVGTLPKEIQLIYSLSVWCERTAMDIFMKTLITPDLSTEQQDLCENYCESNKFIDKERLLMDIVMMFIKDEYQLWDKSNVDVRKDWQVVWFISSNSDILGDQLGCL
jgi:hypothetical protein